MDIARAAEKMNGRLGGRAIFEGLSEYTKGNSKSAASMEILMQLAIALV